MVILVTCIFTSLKHLNDDFELQLPWLHFTDTISRPCCSEVERLLNNTFQLEGEASLSIYAD